MTPINFLKPHNMSMTGPQLPGVPGQAFVAVNLETNSIKGGDPDKVRKRTREVLHRVLVGVGGTGARIVRSIGNRMELQGMRYGEVDIPRETLVAAYVIDTHDETFEGTPLSNRLKELGVGGTLVKIPDEPRVFGQLGIRERVTPGLRAKEDVKGSGAEPRHGHARWAAASTLKANPSSERHPNPREGLKDVMGEFKDQDEETPGISNVVIDVFFSLGGGTGMGMAPAVAAAAKADALTKFGRDKTVVVRMWAVGANPFAKLTDGPDMQETREINSAVGRMELLRHTIQGGVQLPFGPEAAHDAFIEGVPNLVYIIDESPQARIDNDEAVEIVAKVLTTQIAGWHSADGVINNIAAKSHIPAADRGNTALADLGRFASFGVSEAFTDPAPGHILIAKKRKFLAAAVGLEGLNAETMRQVEMKGEYVFSITNERPDHVDPATPFTIEDIKVASIEKLQGEFTKPIIRPGSIIKTGEEKNASQKVSGELNNFEMGLDATKIDFLDKLTAELQLCKAKLQDVGSSLHKQEGLNATGMFIQELQNKLFGLTSLLEPSTKTLKQKLASLREQKNLDRVLDPIKNFKMPTWAFWEKDNAIKALSQAVDSLAAHCKNIAETEQDLTIQEFMLSAFIPEMLRELDKLKQANDLRIATAQDIYNKVDVPFDPDTAKTSLDLAVGVQLLFKPNAKLLRQQLNGFNGTDMKALVDGVSLEPSDTSLVGELDEDIVKACARLAAPMFQESELIDHDSFKGPVTDFTMPIETRQKIIGGVLVTEEIPSPARFKRLKVAENGSFMAIRELHGIMASEDESFLRGLEKLLAKPPEQRITYFKMMGMMEEMAGSMTKVLAEKRHILDARRVPMKETMYECNGNSDVPGCNLTFYIPEGVKKTDDCCAGCKKSMVRR